MHKMFNARRGSMKDRQEARKANQAILLKERKLLIASNSAEYDENLSLWSTCTKASWINSALLQAQQIRLTDHELRELNQ